MAADRGLAAVGFPEQRSEAFAHPPGPKRSARAGRPRTPAAGRTNGFSIRFRAKGPPASLHFSQAGHQGGLTPQVCPKKIRPSALRTGEASQLGGQGQKQPRAPLGPAGDGHSRNPFPRKPRGPAAPAPPPATPVPLGATGGHRARRRPVALPRPGAEGGGPTALTGLGRVAVGRVGLDVDVLHARDAPAEQGAHGGGEQGGRAGGRGAERSGTARRRRRAARTHGGGARHAGRASPPAPRLQLPAGPAAAPTNRGAAWDTHAPRPPRGAACALPAGGAARGARPELHREAAGSGHGAAPCTGWMRTLHRGCARRIPGHTPWMGLPRNTPRNRDAQKGCTEGIPRDTPCTGMHLANRTKAKQEEGITLRVPGQDSSAPAGCFAQPRLTCRLLFY